MTSAPACAGLYDVTFSLNTVGRFFYAHWRLNSRKLR
jgi:hypothetical protein